MYAKDKLGIKGFIQQGAQEDRSYYYSLPCVEIVCRINYTGKRGVRREIDVTGQGWVDRQRGDFLTTSWEWCSLRFSKGARVNLYNFANGYQPQLTRRLTAPPNGGTPLSSATTATLGRPSKEYGCRGAGATNSPSRGRAVATTRWSRLASSMSTRTRAMPCSKVLRASSMTTQEKWLGWRSVSRWPFALCRTSRMLPTRIDGFKGHAC
jgi:hypothetical protein